MFARWYDASITALHVCNPLVVPSANFTLAGIAVPPALTGEDVQGVREQVLACFPSAGPLDIEVVVESGPPADRILARANAQSAALVVIGTHGAGARQVGRGNVEAEILPFGKRRVGEGELR